MLSILTPALILSPAAFNDGWIGNGGAPKLMDSHPTVRMGREVVDIRIGRKHTTVDAKFWFKNEGKSATVRIGFPDDNSDDYYAGTPVLERFTSWADGHRVKTTFEKGEDGLYWHVKKVAFPAGQTRLIRNTYSVPTGLVTMGPPGYFLLWAQYILHTGASWKGTIGESVVRVTFAPDLPAPKRLVTHREWEKVVEDGKTPLVIAATKNHRSTVIYTGPPNPTIRGRTLEFRRSNWRPTQSDDINLTFFPHYDLARYEGEND